MRKLDNCLSIVEDVTKENFKDICSNLERGIPIYIESQNVKLEATADGFSITDLSDAMSKGGCNVLELISDFWDSKTELFQKTQKVFFNFGNNLSDLFNRRTLDIVEALGVKFIKKSISATEVFTPFKSFEIIIEPNNVGSMKTELAKILVTNNYQLESVQFEGKYDSKTIDIDPQLYPNLAYELCNNKDYDIKCIDKVGKDSVDIFIYDSSEYLYRIIYNNESIEMTDLIESFIPLNMNKKDLKEAIEKLNLFGLSNAWQRKRHLCLFLEIIKRDPYLLEYINPKMLSDEHYKLAVSLDGGLLSLVPINLRSKEICDIAIENEPFAENFIPN